MKALIIAAGVMLTVGCASTQKDMDKSFGVATRANMDAQIIDKTPAQGAPAGSAMASDLAILRYNTDTVKSGDTGEFEAGDEASEKAK